MKPSLIYNCNKNPPKELLIKIKKVLISYRGDRGDGGDQGDRKEVSLVSSDAQPIFIINLLSTQYLNVKPHIFLSNNIFQRVSKIPRMCLFYSFEHCLHVYIVAI